ncbi:MAG: hypothetical protein LBO09_03525 [Candidatus Peribacteria bacterium]|jgi:hypothetical protein|nr:hypothetical protein [Candidatus Peribacteria bacterium]
MTSYSYSVFIPTGGFLVLADKQAVFEDSFTDATINSTHKFPDFDIPDTSEILIDLIIDEQVVDNFFVHQYWVEYLQGYRESLHKIF